MKKCDFCKKYDPGFDGKGPSCDGWAGSSYCEEAIEKMTEVLKSMKITPKPKQDHDSSDEDFQRFFNRFFGQ